MSVGCKSQKSIIAIVMMFCKCVLPVFELLPLLLHRRDYLQGVVNQLDTEWCDRPFGNWRRIQSVIIFHLQSRLI